MKHPVYPLHSEVDLNVERKRFEVRFYTHGWDLFSPSENLVFHLWQRDYRRVYAEDLSDLYQELTKSSRRRLHAMCLAVRQDVNSF